MGLDNPIHIAFLVVILLLIFGAKRLPEIGRSLGSGMREFKQSVTGENQASHTQASALPTPPPTMPVAAPQYATPVPQPTPGAQSQYAASAPPQPPQYVASAPQDQPEDSAG